MPDDMRKEAIRIARGIYDGSLTEGHIDPAMTKMVADELRKAVIEGFGKDLPKIDYGTPDYKMLSNLEKNLYQFAGAKNWQMLKSMSLALRDENGNLRSFEDFKKEALNICGAYNVKNLKTEYNTAVASSQMAAKWVDFEKNKTVAEWLRYDTANDSRVRQSHQLLNGVTKKIDDPFWQTYYPPNSWNCRCDVTQLIHGVETKAHDIAIPTDVPPEFQTNMAKNGFVFPKNSAYYKDVPPHELKKAEDLRDAHYSHLYSNAKTGGKVQISSKADEADRTGNIIKSQRLADFGEVVGIRPHVTAQKQKNPELDLYNATQIGDFTKPNPKSESTFKTSYESRITDKGRQGCQIPVLEFDENNYNKADLIKALNNKNLFSAKKKTTIITEVWLMFETKLVKLTREEIALKNYYNKLP